MKTIKLTLKELRSYLDFNQLQPGDIIEVIDE